MNKSILHRIFVTSIIFLLILSSLTILTVKAQNSKAPKVEWTKTFGGTGADVGWSLVETIDGGYAITGSMWTSTGKKIWLIKTDMNGEHQWNNTYGGRIADGFCLVESRYGGYTIVGITESIRGLDIDVWLIKTDQKGIQQWNQLYGGTGTDWGQYVVETSDGGYIITGYTQPTDLADVWLGKTDFKGNLLWSQSFGGYGEDIGVSVVEANDGGYTIVGVTSSFGAGLADVWLLKTDNKGNLQWNQTYGGSAGDIPYSVIETNDGGYAIIGYSGSFDSFYVDTFLIKTDDMGNVQWNQTCGGVNNDMGHSLIQTMDGGYLVTGSTDPYESGDRDLWLFKTDNLGNIEWNQTYGGLKTDVGHCVIETTNGDYVMVGLTYSYDANSADVYLLKVGYTSSTPPLNTTPTPINSPDPTPTPPKGPLPTLEQHPTTFEIAIIVVASVFGVGLLVNLVKKRSKN